MTNREWLASMSNKELADFLQYVVETSAEITAWECWLEAEHTERKKEHEEDGETSKEAD